jgi:hypothetical protein
VGDVEVLLDLKAPEDACTVLKPALCFTVFFTFIIRAHMGTKTFHVAANFSIICKFAFTIGPKKILISLWTMIFSTWLCV